MKLLTTSAKIHSLNTLDFAAALHICINQLTTTAAAFVAFPAAANSIVCTSATLHRITRCQDASLVEMDLIPGR
jgi:hypothetical protein